MSTGRAHGGVEPIFTIDEASRRVSLVWRDQDGASTGYYLVTPTADDWSAPLAVVTASRQFMVADDGNTIYVSYLKQVMIDGVPDTASRARDLDRRQREAPQEAEPHRLLTNIDKIINDDFRPSLGTRQARVHSQAWRPTACICGTATARSRVRRSPEPEPHRST